MAVTGTTCITTYVYGDYTRFIPYYVWSTLRSYPDYFVKIFVDGRLRPGETAAMAEIARAVSTRFEVIEGYQIAAPCSDPRLLRWLVPEAEFAGFDNVYYGDVDFLIIPESPDLATVHVDHCTGRGLPYSNEVRPSGRRMSGLHFVQSPGYFEVMGPIIELYRGDPELMRAACGRYNDEEFLYHLLERGFGAPQEGGHFRPHHGLHLGLLRMVDDGLGFRFANPELSLYRSSHRHMRYLRVQLEEQYRDPMFAQIRRLCPEVGVLVAPLAMGLRVRGKVLLTVAAWWRFKRSSYPLSTISIVPKSRAALRDAAARLRWLPGRLKNRVRPHAARLLGEDRLQALLGLLRRS